MLCRGMRALIEARKAFEGQENAFVEAAGVVRGTQKAEDTLRVLLEAVIVLVTSEDSQQRPWDCFQAHGSFIDTFKSALRGPQISIKILETVYTEAVRGFVEILITPFWP